MFNTYQSNSLQKLANHFSRVLKPDNDDPLVKPWIIVQNNEIKEWLSLRISEEHGIAGNFRFIFPSEFQWTLYRLFKDEIPQVLPSDLNSMHWLLFEVFSSNPELLKQIPFYSPENDNPKKRFQLCGQLADNFDQYQVYRPEMMESWLQRKFVTKDPNERWQLLIWNQLNEYWVKHKISKELPSRSKSYSELIGWVNDPSHPIWSEIPQNLYVFGLSHLSDPFLKLVSLIGERNNVHLFTLEKPDFGVNERLSKLIEDWSKPRKDQDLLLRETLEQKEIPFELQKLEPNSEQAFPDFKVHSCHNPRREVQVLKDEILRYLDHNPESKASDILVMVPDAEAYSGILETTFSEEEGEPSLPVSRTSVQNYHSAEHTLTELLELLSSAFKTSAVLQFLNHESIRTKFSFSDSDLDLLEDWVLENRIYRGIGDDFNTKYSWQKGLNQILSGFSLDPESLDLYKDLVPYGRISSSEEALLTARFSHFIHTLKTAAEEISEEKKPLEWIEFSVQLISDFLGNEDSNDTQVRKIRILFKKLREQISFTVSDRKVSFGLIKEWLIGQLSAQDSSSGRFGQGITVSSYIPYRSVPFRFIAMLGMNESVFPRKAIRPEFDLIYAEPKPGDRIMKEDDTFLFLETIQAAKDHLHISYRGQDQHSDSIRLPSILVQQLLDAFYDSPEKGILKHSLHPFNKRYFKNDDIRSYSGVNSQLSERMLSGKGTKQSGFIDSKLTSIKSEKLDQIHISDLIYFFTHPSKYILQNGFSISNYSSFKEIVDRESFKLDSLDRYKLDDLLFEALRKEESADKVMKYATASAMIPESLQGSKAFVKEKESISAFVELLKTYTKAEEHSEEISIEVAGIQLYGTIHGLYDNLLVTYRVGRRRADHEVGHWLKHLLLLESGYDIQKSLYLSKEGSEIDVFEISSSDIPKDTITKYMNWFLDDNSVMEKVAFFPQSSKAYAEAIFEGKEVEEAIKKANSKWEITPHKSFAEETDYNNALVWRGCNPIESAAFKENAMRFWEPFLWTQKKDQG